MKKETEIICERRGKTEREVRELLSKVQRRYNCQTRTARDIIIAIVGYIQKESL